MLDCGRMDYEFDDGSMHSPGQLDGPCVMAQSAQLVAAVFH